MAAVLPPDSIPIQRVDWLPDLGVLIRVDTRPVLVWLLDGMPFGPVTERLGSRGREEEPEANDAALRPERHLPTAVAVAGVDRGHDPRTWYSSKRASALLLALPGSQPGSPKRR